MGRDDGLRVLLIDLNNFARYPTISVGYLCSVLRKAGCEVEVLSPLAHGVPGLEREPQPRPWSLLDQRLRYRAAASSHAWVASARERLQRLRSPLRPAAWRRLMHNLRACLDRNPDIVLVSTYLMYHEWCAAIGELCAERDTPMVVGGGYFTQPEVAEAWLRLPGLRALVAGEAEAHVAALVRAVVAGEPVHAFPGVSVPDRAIARPAPPLKDLDSIPFPDYSDFPWQAYPSRIVPMITGRGCEWGVCSFCSDVTSSMGRTFRSRSPSSVLEEAAVQARAHTAGLFTFTDIKLNSSLPVWRALLDGFQRQVPGGRWIGAVHVGASGENGLTAAELRDARRAGAVRLTTGLESGSQRVLDLMHKGTDLGITSRFLHDAARSGISVRTTLIIGYPGEGPADLMDTARFLDAHAGCIDRVSLNRLAITQGTPLHRRLDERPDRFPELTELAPDPVLGSVRHRSRATRDPAHRRAVHRLLASVHAINRKRLGEASRAFDGVM